MANLQAGMSDTLTVQAAADALRGTYESVWSLMQDGPHRAGAARPHPLSLSRPPSGHSPPAL